ncbi:hypothetical protein ABER61_24245 [Brevibacillus formosus]|uniref:Uncharacterized protein n=1 Tax=Brevibacillus formosus TaxID=54913 RepID=A0A837KMD7_9BACL|nr:MULTISPECIES: hypothetical protein [Brevibacillus]KLH98353.1 hypothetical protein AA984_15195 [Brevibacillus formosus]MED1948213.1 hypothetical protein [Brevibacillus formosus]MED1960692.1 hypothetical protein [Brevibacillus formosus]MED1998056.1 hypothetical protein [Brevibacillus formosus]MED2080597.1 hypothetical protein [Brevibacillus formosus]
MKVNPRDPIVKFAILEAHNFVCFYTKERLNLLNCTIDHIIPQSFENKSDILLKYIKNYTGEFDINNLDNLVPSSFDANTAKGDKEYDVNTVLHYIEQAKSKVQKISKRIEQLKTYKNIERSLAIISNHVISSTNPREEISKLIEFINNERDSFEEKHFVSDDHFVLSLPSVSLDAYLPRSFKEQGCCLLMFRSLFLSDCMITLNHHQIIQQLFKGLNTKPQLGKRGFIPFINQYSPNIYYVQIGNNRFTLLENEVEELCQIVDEFSNVYINKFKSLEKQYETCNFNKINPINFSVNMFEMNRHLWNLLVQFSWEFDYAKGNTEWHIFNATNGTIVIYPNNTILSRFYPVHSENNVYSSFMHLDESVCIVWEPIEQPDLINMKTAWGAKEAYLWMTKKFIPYVIYYTEIVKKKKSFKRTITYAEFQNQFDINQYINFSSFAHFEHSLGTITNLSELNSLVGNLQVFFTSNQNIYISPIEAKKTYEALSLLVLHTLLPDYAYDYIGGKLSCDKIRTQSGILQFLKHKINTIDQHEYNEITIDLICRCILEVIRYTIRQPSLAINQAILDELKSLLFPIWKKYEVEKYIIRMAN